MPLFHTFPRKGALPYLVRRRHLFTKTYRPFSKLASVSIGLSTRWETLANQGFLSFLLFSVSLFRRKYTNLFCRFFAGFYGERDNDRSKYYKKQCDVRIDDSIVPAFLHLINIYYNPEQE